MITREATGLFYNIRKAIVAFWVLMFGLVAFYVYQHRQVFHPLVLWVDLWQNRAPLQPKVGKLSGQVTKVYDGGTFTISLERLPPYHCRLTGLELPPVHQPALPGEREFRTNSRNFMASLILSNDVRMDLTFSRENTGLAMVYAGSTNINSLMLEAGMARLNREYIKTMPLSEQYMLVRAQDRAKRSRAGLWGAPGTNSIPDPALPKRATQ